MDSMIQAVLQATFVSKCVLALLLCMSVASWAYMCSKWLLLRTAQQRTQTGLAAFRSTLLILALRAAPSVNSTVFPALATLTAF